MKVLQLCSKPPYPPVDGGTLAMNSITQGLLAAGCEVRVLAMCSEKHPVLEDRIPDDYRRATRFEAVFVDLRLHPLDAGVAMLCGDSYHVRRFESKAFAARLAQVLQEETFDIVHVESIFLAPYVPVIRRHTNAPVILRTHNVENQIWRRMAMSERNCCKRWYIKHLALTLRAYEREHVNDFDGVVSITDNDADYFRSEGCRKPIVTIPFAITPARVDGVAEQPGTLFHLGSMDWLPNQEGVRWFLDRVWPLIHSQMPSLTLHLAGRRMSDQLLNLKLEGVHIVGEVPDAATFIASKQINVVPLLSGSGIRVKIIEAMSQGKAVVTTTVGAQGIGAVDGRHLLIADTPERFATQIRCCVDDPAFRQAVGANARQFIADHYGIEPLTRQLLAFYDKRLNIE